MRLSIRTRLVLWFSGVMFLGMTAFSLFLYHRYDRTLDTILRHDLEHEASEVKMLLLRAENRPFLMRFIDEISRPIESENDFLLCITDAQGRELIKTPSLGSRSLPLTTSFTSHDGDEEGRVDTVSDPRTDSNQKLRIYTCRLETGLSTVLPGAAFLQIAQPTHKMDKRLAKFRVNAILGVLVMLVFSVGAGIFLTRKALKPVADITERASAVGASDLGTPLPVRGTGDELDRLAEVLNGMLLRLKDAFSRNRRFAAAAAHQLRTPLTAMRGELELVARRDNPPETQSVLEALQDEVDRMTTLCRRLLLLMKVEESAGPSSRVDWAEVDLAQLVADLARGAGLAGEARGVAVEFSVPDDDVFVSGSAGMLGEAIYNLLDNAVKYTPEGGTVTAAVEVRDTMAAVCIADTGPGISGRTAATIFEYFQRGNDAKATLATGFGLGLPIARGIIERHGGRIELEPSGQGARFAIRLPLLARRPQRSRNAEPAPTST